MRSNQTPAEKRPRSYWQRAPGHGDVIAAARLRSTWSGNPGI